MAERLRDKVCIITGASSGIGKAIAELFADEGGKVILADIQEGKGKGAADLISARGGIAFFHRLDVTDEASWQSIVEFALKTYGKLDVLVNNAGINIMNPILDTTLSDWRKVMAINAEGPFLGVKHAVPAMKKNGKKGGSIINISSNIVLAPAPNNSAYISSKAAVCYFTKAASIEFARDRIRINNIYPGFVQTPILEVAFQQAEKAGRSREDVLELIAQSNLLNQVGQPLDLAYPVLFLASDEAAYVTGADFVIDGGEVWQRGGINQAIEKDAAVR
jgi:NAD(P)-dependent dehydrogenase (short-subunit alcohol dehydrogenase family)